MKGKFSLIERFDQIRLEDRFISEISLAELKFGVQNSQYPEKNQAALLKFLECVQVLAISSAIDFYSFEKARLRKTGFAVDDFDLLIGSTAVVNGLTLVTNNERHFFRIKGIQIVNWIN
ncbi:hypothetical protein GCM10009119_08660 [Algoriphagus jejuensis]|uniref:PIN domain-containing protein n=2 Tax=Algoriphagus jejuensis TaxID=419934 RepID=A0ABP3YBB8_9BACT